MLLIVKHLLNTDSYFPNLFVILLVAAVSQSWSSTWKIFDLIIDLALGKNIEKRLNYTFVTVINDIISEITI